MTRRIRTPYWTTLLALFLTLFPPLWSQTPRSARSLSSISTGWEFRQSNDSKLRETQWHPATVPGQVHLDLLKNGLIPDPYYRDNEAKLQWIEDAAWSYRTSFQVSPEQLASTHLEMVFEGLDTTAEVFVNDRSVLKADNMFRTWRIDAKTLVHSGANSLRIEFSPALKTAAKLAELDTMDTESKVPEKSFLRKAAYEFGWDWGPRLVTYGVWKPVDLECWDKARIESMTVQQLDIKASVAHVNVLMTINSTSDQSAEIHLGYAVGSSPVAFERKIDLHIGLNTVSIPLEIAHPQLWFPAGYGAQPLYDFHASLTVHGRQQDEQTVQTGLRSIELRRESDQWGRSFEFIVNGIPIFAKGADVIPFDSFPDRVTDDRYKRILESARDSNMNMIRLWGGGYYESEKFYELCDQLGLLVWQDMMFASSWYPGDYDWKLNVREEATQQIDRLRNHPSVALYSGNNEVESVLYAFLGGQSEKGRLQIWKNYLTVFSGILPEVVKTEDPEVPYWPSSPSADYEPTSDAFQSGDAHDWSIWHGREPFANYRKHFYRFTSEYGFQSFPELRTVESFTTHEDRANIFTPVMLAHQKNNEGNSIIHDYLLRDYGEPKDFASFLYVSQVLQAEGVKEGAEHMRRNRPRIMGSLYWQLNDCWPVASWSSIDSFGRWKALQYYSRRFYSPLLVSPVINDSAVDVYAVSDRTDSMKATVRIRTMSLAGKSLSDQTKEVTLPPLSSAKYLSIPFQQLLNKDVPLDEQFVVTNLLVNGAAVSSNIVYLEPTKQVHLLPTTIQSSVTAHDGALTVTLSSQVLARDVYITLGDLDATLSDNYFDLIPGESVKIDIRGNLTEQQVKDKMKIVSLVDAFPQAGATSSQHMDSK